MVQWMVCPLSLNGLLSGFWRAKIRKSFDIEGDFRRFFAEKGEKRRKSAFCGSKIVDDVVLLVEFGVCDDDAEASEVEADGAEL